VECRCTPKRYRLPAAISNSQPTSVARACVRACNRNNLCLYILPLSGVCLLTYISIYYLGRPESCRSGLQSINVLSCGDGALLPSRRPLLRSPSIRRPLGQTGPKRSVEGSLFRWTQRGQLTDTAFGPASLLENGDDVIFQTYGISAPGPEPDSGRARSDWKPDFADRGGRLVVACSVAVRPPAYLPTCSASVVAWCLETTANGAGCLSDEVRLPANNVR